MNPMQEFDAMVASMMRGKPPNGRFRLWLWHRGWLRGEDYTQDEVKAIARAKGRLVQLEADRDKMQARLDQVDIALSERPQP